MYFYIFEINFLIYIFHDLTRAYYNVIHMTLYLRMKNDINLINIIHDNIISP